MTSTEDTTNLVSDEELPDETQGDVDVFCSPQSISGNDSLPGAKTPNDNVTETSRQQQNGADSNGNVIPVESGDVGIGPSESYMNGAQPERINYENVPVCYSSTNGVFLVRKPVLQTNTDGSRVIVTSQHEITGAEERPLRAKDIRFVTIFSVVALIVFFPLGLPALLLSLQAIRDFQQTMEVEDLERIKKKVKIAERLILLSIVVGVLGYVLIYAVVQRQKYGHHDHITSLHWNHL